MKVSICIGSSCHIKGSRHIVEDLQYLVSEYSLQDLVELSGTFCMGQCQHGVCIMVDGVLHSVPPENVNAFFGNEILAKIS